MVTRDPGNLDTAATPTTLVTQVGTPTPTAKPRPLDLPHSRSTCGRKQRLHDCAIYWKTKERRLIIYLLTYASRNVPKESVHYFKCVCRGTSHPTTWTSKVTRWHWEKTTLLQKPSLSHRRLSSTWLRFQYSSREESHWDTRTLTRQFNAFRNKINYQKEDFIKELKSIKKDQTEILELKNSRMNILITMSHTKNKLLFKDSLALPS